MKETRRSRKLTRLHLSGVNHRDELKISRNLNRIELVEKDLLPSHNSAIIRGNHSRIMRPVQAVLTQFRSCAVRLPGPVYSEASP